MALAIPSTASPAMTSLRDYSTGFAAAAALLDPLQRDEVEILYRFCKSLDHVADELPPPVARPVLAGIVEALASGDASHVLVIDYLELARRRSLSPGPILRLAETLQADIGNRRLQDEEELRDYCFGAAGTVGLLMAELLGGAKETAPPFAASLGVAMQMTNIARDVVQDARLGRVYLPAAWLGGPVSPAEILTASDACRRSIYAAIERLLALAAEHYRLADGGLALLPPRSRVCVAAASAGYEEIGRAIQRRGFDGYWSPAVALPTAPPGRSLLRRLAGALALPRSERKPGSRSLAELVAACERLS